MSGPKHLWSGDWENESEDASTRRVREPRPVEPEPSAPPPAAAPRPRRAVRPWVVPAAIAVLVIAAAAFGLSKVLGSSSRANQNNASVLKPLPRPHVTGNTRPIEWLGMELITAPQGVPVVETVRPNSNGDRAGIEPGDAILLINKNPVGSTGSITDALKGLHSGDKVALTVSTGGAVLQLFATLAAPPSPYP